MAELLQADWPLMLAAAIAIFMWLGLRVWPRPYSADEEDGAPPIGSLWRLPDERAGLWPTWRVERTDSGWVTLSWRNMERMRTIATLKAHYRRVG